MRNYDLQPYYDSRASFYGKARVEVQDNNDLHLISYSTHVATIDNQGDEPQAIVFGTYSQTTLRHIKEFLKQCDLKAINSKQIMADYGTRVLAGTTHQGDFV